MDENENLSNQFDDLDFWLFAKVPEKEDLFIIITDKGGFGGPAEEVAPFRAKALARNPKQWVEIDNGTDEPDLINVEKIDFLTANYDQGVIEFRLKAQKNGSKVVYPVFDVGAPETYDDFERTDWVEEVIEALCKADSRLLSIHGAQNGEKAGIFSRAENFYNPEILDDEITVRVPIITSDGSIQHRNELTYPNRVAAFDAWYDFKKELGPAANEKPRPEGP